jgi:U2 small nuclear ribonucleoprotein B''
MAQVIYENAELATVAREALNGFLLKKGWQMSIAFI